LFTIQVIVNIQTAQNVMTYRHSPRNSPTLLSTNWLELSYMQ